MIKIIKNGREKTFRGKCFDCATEFSYQTEDVTEVEMPGAVLDWLKKQRYVKCPVCDAQVSVTLMTDEEWTMLSAGGPICQA